MARRRWINPSFWDDQKIGKQLTPIERLFLVGCFSNADDEGRLVGDALYLRSTIFKYDDMPLEEVTRIRDKLVTTMRCLTYYEVDGEEYIAFHEKNWKREQNPQHPKPSEYPAPPESFVNPSGNSPAEGEKPAGEPIEDAQNASSLGRVGLGRVGLGRDMPRKRDPRLDHPAIIGYRDTARLTMVIALRDDWIACADDLGTDVLLRYVKEWIGKGYRPQNVVGIMEYARRGGDGRTHKQSIEDAELAQYRPAWQAPEPE